MTGRTGAVAAVLLCALAACAPPTTSSGEDSASLPGSELSDVDVDTPELAKLREAAGIPVCPEADATAEPVADGLPELTLPCLGGGPDVELSALRGEPMVLNVWASWCGPCEQELPVLQRLHGTGAVRVLGVDIEDPQPDTALELAGDNGVTYPSVADTTGRTRTSLQVNVVPQTVYVEPDGTVVATERKPYTSYGDLAADVREHLGVRV